MRCLEPSARRRQRPDDVLLFMRRLLAGTLPALDSLGLAELSVVVKAAKKTQREVKKVRKHCLLQNI